MAGGTRKRVKKPKDLAERIVDEALRLGSEEGWQHDRLLPLAERMGITVNEIRQRYADPDAIADAWFARALDAMLAPPPDGFAELPAVDRLEVLMLRWFDALAPYRRVTAEMLAAKLHPPHVHHWAPAVFHLSRKIQLLRDSARLRATGRRRQIEEVGLTALFVTTLFVWCRDNSPGQERTRRALSAWLSRADRVMARLPVR